MCIFVIKNDSLKENIFYTLSQIKYSHRAQAQYNFYKVWSYESEQES